MRRAGRAGRAWRHAQAKWREMPAGHVPYNRFTAGARVSDEADRDRVEDVYADRVYRAWQHG